MLLLFITTKYVQMRNEFQDQEECFEIKFQ
jgi:hypothetical protein